MSESEEHNKSLNEINKKAKYHSKRIINSLKDMNDCIRRLKELPY